MALLGMGRLECFYNAVSSVCSVFAPRGVICMVGSCGTTTQFSLSCASLNSMEYVVES